MLKFIIDFNLKNYNLKYSQKNQIEAWTKMKMKDIVFDSTIHKWKKDESEFDKLILNKENLLFLIQTDDNIKFGGFISSKIYKYNPYFIYDEKAFVFTFKDNKPMKFDIKKDKKYDAFYLCDKSHFGLFQIGYDIDIYKQNKKSHILQEERSSFDYQGIENALIGKTGYFWPKRIKVFQMK